MRLINTKVLSNENSYAWIIVAVASFIYFSNVGLVIYGAPILNTRMIVDEGFNTTILGIASGLNIITQAVGSIFTGYIIRKRGLKPAYIMGSLLLMLGSFMMAHFMVSQTLFVLFYGVLIGFGYVESGTITAQSAIVNWFVYNKAAFPLAIVTSMAGIVGIVGPIFFNYICSINSWITGWQIMFFMSSISLILSVLFIKDNPNTRKANLNSNTILEVQQSIKNNCKDELSLKELLRNTTFYMLLFNNLSRQVIYFTFLTHIIIHLVKNGMPSTNAAQTISIFAIASMFGRFSLTLLGRYIKSKTILTISNILFTLSMVLFCYAAFPMVSYIASIMLGIGFGLGIVQSPIAVSEYFGPENFSFINGIIFACSLSVTSVATLLTGISATFLGAYNLAFYILSLFSLLGGIAVQFCKPLEIQELS